MNTETKSVAKEPKETILSAQSTQVGIGFGCALAITISWSVNHSVVWAIIHGLLSWLYVIYWCLTGEAPWQAN